MTLASPWATKESLGAALKWMTSKIMCLGMRLSVLAPVQWTTVLLASIGSVSLAPVTSYPFLFLPMSSQLQMMPSRCAGPKEQGCSSQGHQDLSSSSRRLPKSSLLTTSTLGPANQGWNWECTIRMRNWLTGEKKKKKKSLNLFCVLETWPPKRFGLFY